MKRNHRRIIVPKGKLRRFYGQGIPGVDVTKLAGKLIVVEGADGSGRSTQIARLVAWLEGAGHATVQVGLKRSTLVSEELDQAQQGNILSHTTLSLFYATDFADQLENIILRASVSLTGRLSWRAATAHSAECGHGKSLPPKPEPMKREIICMFSLGKPSTCAMTFRWLTTPCELS